MMKRLMLAAILAHVCASTGLAADPAISVEARQRYPWNGLVDLHFTITGTAGTKYDTSFTAKDMVGNTNIAMRTIRKPNGTAANVAKEQLTPGTYNWIWDAAADLPKGWKSDRVTVTGKAVVATHLYMVVNLSSGAVSYLDSVPSGGWTDNPYKQTKMVFRRIESGTFSQTIGPNSTRNVTITKPFYISVNPLTSYQGLTLNCLAPADHLINVNGWSQSTTTVLFGDWTDNNHKRLYYLIAQSEKSTYNPPCLVLRMNAITKLSFTIPTEAQLTLARHDMSLGSTYTFSRDWFFSDLGNTAVTNPCQGRTYNGKSADFMSCVNQTARAYTKDQGGYNPSVDGFTGKTVCVRLCLVVDE